MDKERERSLYESIRGKTFDEVGEHFPLALVRFRELQGGQQLPSLKLVLRKQKRE